MKDSKIKVGIIGATGYAGVELVRLLLAHPNVEIGAVSSVSFEGRAISEIYPSLHNIYDAKLGDEESVTKASDVVFAALPHGLSEPIAKKCIKLNKLFIDLGADFRLDSQETYKEWYEKKFDEPGLHKQSIYSIPELHRDKIQDAKIIANPGCYTTCIPLGLAPLVKSGKAQLDSIVIDAKSGTTGAGRGLTQTTHFPELNEGFCAYKVAQHRHTPEIEQTLSQISGEDVKVTFVPHLIPINRGILATMYINTDCKSEQELYDMYQDFYKNEQFIRILPLGQSADVKNCRLSNYCDISLHLDRRTGRAIIISAIDNMVKGASGQAIQNMNIALRFDESAGLSAIPPSF